MHCLSGIVPVVHDKIAKISENYNNNGKKLKFVSQASSEGQEMMLSNFVGIMNPRAVNYSLKNNLKKLNGRDSSISIATGWALNYGFNGYDKVFALSDHADFYQLMRYLELVRPKRVYTTHGYNEEFASHVKKRLGIQATPLNKKGLLTNFL